jgi:hypothetical protein
MYPPKVTDSLEESASNLLASLQRGGDQWTGEVNMLDTGDGCTRFALRLNQPIPEAARKDLMAYAREYIRRSGWKVRGVKMVKRYLEVIVSNA